jgi:hypothetical protein
MTSQVKGLRNVTVVVESERTLDCSARDVVLLLLECVSQRCASENTRTHTKNRRSLMPPRNLGRPVVPAQARPAPPPRGAPEVVVQFSNPGALQVCFYETPDHTRSKDVTAVVSQLVASDGSANFLVMNNVMGGDPALGIVKQLRLIFKGPGGQETTHVVQEYQRAVILARPPPPAAAPAAPSLPASVLDTRATVALRSAAVETAQQQQREAAAAAGAGEPPSSAEPIVRRPILPIQFVAPVTRFSRRFFFPRTILSLRRG